MPLVVKFWKRQSMMVTDFPDVKLSPLVPNVVPVPLIERPRSITLAGPGLPEERIEANVPVPAIVIDLVMVTTPKPPGSSASISPAAAVLEMGPAKVLQGAVRLQGLASSPTPDTQVRVACALAAEAKVSAKSATATALIMSRNLFILESPFPLKFGGATSRTRIVPATAAPSLPIERCVFIKTPR